MTFLIYFLLCCFESLTLSQCFVDTTSGSTTTVSYDLTSIQCTPYITEAIGQYASYYYILESVLFEQNNLIVDFRNYPARTDGIETYAHYYESPLSPNLETVTIKPNNIFLTLYTQYIKDNTHFYIGCFNENGCEPPSSLRLYFFNSSLSIFSDQPSVNGYFNLHFWRDNSNNVNGYPFLFVSFPSLLQTNIDFQTGNDQFNFEEFVELSGSYYLYTSVNTENHNLRFYDDVTDTQYENSEFLAYSVCSRKNVNRNVMFYQDHTPYTNCSCYTRNNDIDITSSSLFNYPDCMYNSSIFDLILPLTSEIYSLSDELLEWYSIQFTTSYQSVEINEGKTLELNELNLNQDGILFNENVYVNNLLVTTIGASFDTLNFGCIEYYDYVNNTILFSIQSTETDLCSFGLELVGNDVIISLNCIPSSSECSFTSESNFSFDSSSNNNNNDSSSCLPLTILSILVLLVVLL
ncbi:Uncharacterized protein QTN25_009095 [Entamoeba marina]